MPDEACDAAGIEEDEAPVEVESAKDELESALAGPEPATGAAAETEAEFVDY